ncbi:hypothetical protein MLD38_012794 [Melastoma candidum]|nr:hypothetical protein MLD38_012794 [Melastoma candidum]
MFGVSAASVLDANELTTKSTIYPFTPLLIPLTQEPTEIKTSPPPPPPPSPPQQESPPAASSQSENHKMWAFIAGGVSGAVLIFVGCFFWRRTKGSEAPSRVPVKKFSAEEPVLATTFIKEPWMLDGIGMKDAIETLTEYSIEDLENATGFFSEESKLKGSVYHGKFKGDSAAIKVLKGDVSSEINILSQINHSNVIRLSGFCVNKGSTYLVYEYAENGSLSDRLHEKDATSALSWKQRVQIAYGTVDALNYLHNYTNPPYVHKNLNSSNILLDGNFRAKVANFGLARSMEDTGGGELRLTRHVVGTHGYLAPEYVENGLITTKMDVFAFGVVMLELLSGREAARDGKHREEMLCVAINAVLDGDNVREKLSSFMDPSLGKEYPLDLAYLVAELAKRCVAPDLNARPAIPEVLVTLSRIFSSTEEWDPSDALDHPGQ